MCFKSVLQVFLKLFTLKFMLKVNQNLRNRIKMKKISTLFQPVNVIPKNSMVKPSDITSKSQRLMVDLGLIRGTGCGSFHLLPLLQKSIEKCIRIIDFYMDSVGAQKLTIPNLTPVELWKKSGRFSSGHTELLTTKDRHDKCFILGPTHEEAITSLLATVAPISYRQFPLRLYQIGTKFRDELKPRFGLMRTKEFLMKDCYSFDISTANALHTYHEFCDVYTKIFQTIAIPFVKVEGDTGIIGGSMSHEFQVLADIGEDSLVKCSNCNFSANAELYDNSLDQCPKCENSAIATIQGIEVAHSFLLDDKYSKILQATFLQTNGKPAPLLMGCYGIGVTRLIAAAIESMATETEIRWPFHLAPYTVCVISPKDGSKEQQSVEHYVAEIYNQLTEFNLLKDDVIVDDRTGLTIGKRLMDAKRIGYPLIVVIGPKACQGTFELHITNENGYYELLSSDLIQTITTIVNKHTFEQ